MSTSPSSLKFNANAEASTEAGPAWKRELNERLAATRARHTRKPEQQSLLSSLDQSSAKEETRAARLAAKVAARYANVPSYSEMLAAEARAAAEAAMAAAEQAHAAAQALLAGLETGTECSSFTEARCAAISSEAAADTVLSPAQSGFTQPRASMPASIPGSAVPAKTSLLLDPVEEEMISPAQPLPVNLIEFPRELIAVRKARPRLAEGPLRETSQEAAHDQTQLRIFEVEQENISKDVKIETAPPEWSSIRLDAKPSSMPPNYESSRSLDLSLKAAPLEDRVMAGIFDVALVLLAFVLFVLVFAACTTHPPVGKAAVSAALLVLVGLFVLYQYLCFRFTDGTLGMRYAKIALCTFEDENPTRKAMRRRIPFLLLSAAPLGLGLAWAWFDGDRLGWHDRMTRMYQRSYRPLANRSL